MSTRNSIIVLVVLAAGFGVFRLVPLARPVDQLSSLDSLESLTVAENIVSQYIEEGYPTAVAISPTLEKLLVTTFSNTQLDALKDASGDDMVLIYNMQFGDSDEFATLVAIPTRKNTTPKSCGVDGLSQMCVLFYTKGNDVEVADIFQTFTKDGRSSEWWNGSPMILEVLSMPYMGQVLMQDERTELGSIVRGWTVVDPDSQTRQAIVRYTVAKSMGQSDVTVMTVEGNGYTLQIEGTEVWSEGASTGEYSHIVFKDGETTLFELDGAWAPWFQEPAPGALSRIIGPDEKAMIAQPQQLILKLGAVAPQRTFIYEGDRFYEQE